jgi:hypothetical protein
MSYRTVLGNLIFLDAVFGIRVRLDPGSGSVSVSAQCLKRFMVTPASLLCLSYLSIPCSILQRVWYLRFRRILYFNLKNFCLQLRIRIDLFPPSVIRVSKTDMFLPGFEPPTVSTVGRLSSKELFEQLALLLFGSSTV